MSTKTTFKRISLGLVAALGFGVLASGPSQATISNETLTVTASATSVAIGETVTLTVTNEWTSSSNTDSRVVLIDSTASGVTGSGPSVYYQTTLDTINVTLNNNTNRGANPLAYQSFPDSYTSPTGAAAVNRVVSKIQLYNFQNPGTYYYTVYSDGAYVRSGAAKSANFTITVTRPSVTGLRAYVSQDLATGYNARSAFNAAVDSSLTAAAGLPTDNNIAGYILLTGLGAGTVTGGDTKTAAGANICTSQTDGYCSFTAEIVGAGQIGLTTTASKASTQTIRSYNGTTFVSQESIVVVSDGRQGTGTITIKSGTTTLLTKTVTFTGPAASATLLHVDTFLTGTGSKSNVFRAYVKDAGGSTYTANDIYLFSSDTGVASDSASTSACVYSVSGYHNCSITVVDSGTVNFTVGNSTNPSSAATATVAAGWRSAALAYTITGNTVGSFTASFDKATYGAGDVAILTITPKDRSATGRAIIDNGTTITGAFTASATRNGSGVTLTGLNGAEDFTSFLSTGSETVAVTMPSQSGTVEVTLGAGANAASTMASQKLTVTVTDASEQAANAALDAAQEATDAAIAATDAAVLAQESADAAAVAAEAAAETAAEAAEAAKAAVDAVTKLSAEVTKLLTQLATLQKLMSRIAKKVGVKV